MGFVNEDCKISCSKVKKGKELNYAIFKFENETNLILDCVGDKNKSWNDFILNLPNDEVRYCVYNLNYISKTDNIERTKFIFLRWTPSYASIKQKMISTFFQKTILNELSTFISIKLQIGSIENLEYNQIVEAATRFNTVK